MVSETVIDQVRCGVRFRKKTIQEKGPCVMMVTMARFNHICLTVHGEITCLRPPFISIFKNLSKCPPFSHVLPTCWSKNRQNASPFWSGTSPFDETMPMHLSTFDVWQRFTRSCVFVNQKALTLDGLEDDGMQVLTNLAPFNNGLLDGGERS